MKKTRFDKAPSRVKEEMKRQPDESKMAFIKRTVMRLYKKRLAKAELSLMLVKCNIRPSNSGVKDKESTLLFTKDTEMFPIGGKVSEEEEEGTDLTDLIQDDGLFDRR